MLGNQLRELVTSIVATAAKLKNDFTDEKQAPVNYACIFAQSENEFQSFTKVVEGLGRIIHRTASVPVYFINGLETISGILRILKIRMPDPGRPERGDADFTVRDYKLFKAAYLKRPGFKLIERPNMEIIELMQAGYDVRAYFSDPPLIKVLGIE